MGCGEPVNFADINEGEVLVGSFCQQIIKDSGRNWYRHAGPDIRIDTKGRKSTCIRKRGI